MAWALVSIFIYLFRRSLRKPQKFRKQAQTHNTDLIYLYGNGKDFSIVQRSRDHELRLALTFDIR